MIGTILRAAAVTALAAALMTNVAPAEGSEPTRYWQVQYCDATGDRGCFPAVVDITEDDALTDACLPGREGTLPCWSAAHGFGEGFAPIPLPGLTYGPVEPGQTVCTDGVCYTLTAESRDGHVWLELHPCRYDEVDEGPYVCFERGAAEGHDIAMIRYAASA